MSLLLTLTDFTHRWGVSIVESEQVNAAWVIKKKSSYQKDVVEIGEC